MVRVGKEVLSVVYEAISHFNISQNSYFKLRDLALILNGTEKQFNVSRDEIKKAR